MKEGFFHKLEDALKDGGVVLGVFGLASLLLGCATTDNPVSNARAHKITELATTTSCQNPLIIRDVWNWGQEVGVIPEKDKRHSLLKLGYNTSDLSIVPDHCSDANLVGYKIPQTQFDKAQARYMDKDKAIPAWLATQRPPVLVVRHITQREARKDPRIKCQYQYREISGGGTVTRDKSGEECRYVY